MTPEEVRAYFAESLFLNQVKYENDKLEVVYEETGEGIVRDLQ